jgi:glycosyltransferase involved in cell wall biosynthesis
MAEMIRKWEEGNKIVVAVKSSSQEHSLMFLARKLFYRVLGALSENDRLISNFTGYGLYDRVFLNVLRKYRDPAPYLRGFVSEIGFRRAEIPFVQPARKHGVSKHSFLSLYDVAMSGMINHSKLPLRLATFSGFLLAGISLLIALGYLVYKLLYWKTFTLGLAPLIIGVFFFSAVQLIFIGVIGEYVGAILSQVKRRPYAVIEETLNCPNPDA